MIKDAEFERIGCKVMHSMPNYYEKYRNNGCVHKSEMMFILGLLKDYRFSDGSHIKNVVEVGMHIGLTDLYMLKTGVKYYQDDFKLYSIEKNNDTEKGYVVDFEATEEEKKQWLSMKDRTTYDVEGFWPSGHKIDMVFIDGAHAHPFPLIDLIFLHPYMREGGLILFHDCEHYLGFGEFGGCYIFSSWIGDKYLTKIIDETSLEVLGEATLGVFITPEYSGG